MDLYFKDIG